LLAPTLSTVLSQRLVRILCQVCKKEVELSGELKKYVLDKISQLPPAAKEKVKIGENVTVFQPVGCKKCNNTGYTGRLGVFEVIEMSDGLDRLILDRAGDHELFLEARKQGMLTMEEDGVLKVLAGITSLEEVMHSTSED